MAAVVNGIARPTPRKVGERAVAGLVDERARAEEQRRLDAARD